MLFQVWKSFRHIENCLLVLNPNPFAISSLY